MTSRSSNSIATLNFPTFLPKSGWLLKISASDMILLSNRPTKAPRLLFGGPIYTKKKLCGNFLTPPFMPKSKKILLLTTKDTIQNLIVKQELPATATNLIITTPRTSCIYFLPKIHKPNNPGRPIVSACSCPIEVISSYLDKIMAPIVKSLPSYIKDSQHALEIFRDFNFLGQDKLIFTMDISSLYTVIPLDIYNKIIQKKGAIILI